MWNRSRAWAATEIPTVVLLVWLGPLFGGPELSAKQTDELSHAAGGNWKPGFITDRLTPKQLKTWEAMERRALAHDEAGQPLHPTLGELFTWAKMSGVPIYIEMPKPQGRWDYAAGECLFEVEQGVLRSRLTTVV